MHTSDKNDSLIDGMVLGRPDLRIKNGTPILTVRIRSRRALPGRPKRWRYSTLDVKMYGGRARQLKRSLRGGTMIRITGYLESRDCAVLVDGTVIRDGSGDVVTYTKVIVVAGKIDRIPRSTAKSSAQRNASVAVKGTGATGSQDTSKRRPAAARPAGATTDPEAVDRAVTPAKAEPAPAARAA